MRLYSEQVFPRLNDLLTKRFVHHRAKVLAQAKGKILEIGFGSGMSLQSYPESVSKVTGLEPNPAMIARSESRINSRAQVVQGSAEKLPFEDGAFDGVASFFTLCSVNSLPLAIEEIKRVLKPGGSLFLIEHVAHPEGSLIRKLQSVFDPICSRLACGCRLTRETTQDLEKSGFKFSELQRIAAESVPSIVGPVYRGIASKV